ncbi:MAG: asparagine synthase-related protein, partial [Gammaproteobacteria bacterium]
MAGVCGWIAAYGDGNVPELAKKMAGRLARHDGSEVHTLGGARSAVAAAAPQGQADVCEHRGWRCALQGHYYWSDSEYSALTEKEGAARTLVNGFERHGTHVLDRLGGSFSVVLVNENRQLAFMATDRIGVSPVNYVGTTDCLVFASDPAALFAYPHLSRRIDCQSVFNYLYFHVVPSPNGVYESQRRVLPGGFVRWDSGELTEGTYWRARYQESASQRPFQELKEEFWSALESSVERFVNGSKLGCFLSGGTDSSTVAGVLDRVQGEPAATYSIGFDAEGYDEM